MPQAELRVVRARVAAPLVEAGFGESRAYDVLRTFSSYVFHVKGSALVEVLGPRSGGCAPVVRLPAASWHPEDLAGVADVFCAPSDPDGQFTLGLDLRLAGLDEIGA